VTGAGRKTSETPAVSKEHCETEPLSLPIASTPMTDPTGISEVPASTRILSRVPASSASSSTTAFSVSISAITSPTVTGSPGRFLHWRSFPSFAPAPTDGMRMLMDIRELPV
jgi:hypothetical protein